MQWIFSLIFFLLLQPSQVSAEEELGVELRLSSASQRTVKAKDLFTSSITILNKGTEEDTYSIKAEIPDTWEIISSLGTCTLLPQESKTIPLTIFVPSTALTSTAYEINIVITSEQDPAVNARADIYVKVLPKARVRVIGPQLESKSSPGGSIDYIFTIINLGNGNDRFAFSATSAHGEKVALSQEIMDLKYGEQSEVKVTIYVPLETSPGTRHCLTFKATSILLEKGVSDETVVYTSILEKKEKKEETFYKTLPAQIITRLSGLGTGKRIGPQAEFYTNGYMTDTYWINFAYQGPYYKDRQNYRGISQEKVSLEFGEDLWDVGLGNTTVNISELTMLSLFEKGARVRINKSPLSATYFELEKNQIGFTEKLTGGKVSAKIGKNSELGLNYFQGDETKTDQSSSRAAEKKEISSISAKHRTDNFTFQGEYASSRFDNGSGDKDDNAWWLNSKLRQKKFYFDSEYIRAGTNYPGRRKDFDGYRSYVSYNFFKPVWIWMHKQKYHNNIIKNPVNATDETDRIEFGGSLTTKKMPFFSLSYAVNNAQSKTQVPLSDAKEKSIIFRSHDSFGNFSISFDSKWTHNKDDITSLNTKTSEYTGRAYERWKKLTTWVGYTYNIEKDISQGSTTTLTKKELGITCQPVSKFSSSFTIIQEGVKAEKSTSTLSLDINYEPWDDSTFYLEGEMRTDNKQSNKAWQFWLAYKQNFDLPLFFLKTKGAIRGIIFIDEDINGSPDKTEPGAGQIKVLVNQNDTVTNKDGRYKLASVAAGECELDVDIASVAVGLAPNMQLPYKFVLHRGETKDINIPLVRVCKIKGVVFDDLNKNGSVDNEEKGLGLIRILLVSKLEISKETFSDNNGRYSFSGILPGEYDVKIDEEWLPERYILTTEPAASIKLKPSDEIDNINFGTIQKEKKIIKTYSTTGEDIVAPTP